MLWMGVPAGTGERVWQRQPRQEIGIRRDEVKRHGIGGVVGDHAPGEVAAAGVRRACCAADDVGERVAVVGVGSQDQVALERPAEVLRANQLAVRVADPAPQLERVGGAAVGRGRQRHGQVGHQLHRAATTHPLVGGQAVVGERQDALEVLA